MSNKISSDVLLGKTVTEADAFIKANRVYHLVDTSSYRIKELDIYEADGASTMDYVETRLCVEIDQNQIITKIHNIG